MTTNELSSEEESRLGIFGAPTKSTTPLLLATELAAEYLEQDKGNEPIESALAPLLARAK